MFLQLDIESTVAMGGGNYGSEKDCMILERKRDLWVVVEGGLRRLGGNTVFLWSGRDRERNRERRKGEYAPNEDKEWVSVRGGCVCV